MLLHTRLKVSVPFDERVDAILPKKGPVTRAMSKRLQENWVSLEERGLVVSSEPVMGNGGLC